MIMNDGKTLKLILLVASTLLSLVAAEIFLRVYVSRFEAEQTFVASPHAQIDFGPDERYDDVYEVFDSSAQTTPWILTVGDSFTNGGNVSWRHSYPYRLFESIGRSATVKNMGICEDTTKGSYIRLADYFEKNRDRASLVVLLVGAADQFFDDLPRFESMYLEAVKGQGIPQETIDTTNVPVAKIHDQPGFLNSLKIFKMTSYLARRARAGLDQARTREPPRGSLGNFDLGRLHICLNEEAPDLRQSCLKESFTAIASQLPEKFDRDLFKAMTFAITRSESRRPQPKNDRIVEDLLTMIRLLPRSLAVQEVIYNTITYASMQSRFDLDKDVISVIRENYASESSFIDARELPELEHPATLIRLLENWSLKYDNVRKTQEEYLLKIIDLVTEHRGELILVTYPLPYRAVNETIRKVAGEKNVPLVDLDPVFQDRIQKGADLIGDWEHCTEEGYELMARSLSDQVKASLRRLRGNHQ
jgi:lysophospholipase L1-like esterase